MVDLNNLKPLEEPYEIFEMLDGETRELRVKNWELGSMEILSRDTQQPKKIYALRVFTPIEFKTVGVPWYDITSKTLIAQIRPFLEQPEFQKKLFKISKFGTAPRARFTVTVQPG